MYKPWHLGLGSRAFEFPGRAEFASLVTCSRKLRAKRFRAVLDAPQLHTEVPSRHTPIALTPYIRSQSQYPLLISSALNAIGSMGRMRARLASRARAGRAAAVVARQLKRAARYTCLGSINAALTAFKRGTSNQHALARWLTRMNVRLRHPAATDLRTHRQGLAAARQRSASDAGAPLARPRAHERRRQSRSLRSLPEPAPHWWRSCGSRARCLLPSPLAPDCRKAGAPA